MAQRGKSTAHPTLTRWCAGVRLGNFTIDSTKAPLCFSAIGALLDYLMRARAVDGFTCDIEELEQVTKIEYVALNDVMQINNDALVSLQVFLSEKHASIYSNAFKEGLSIYGILNHTRTPLGSALLRQWLLRPSRSLTVIRHRHEAVSFFLKADNLAQSDILHKHIGGLKGAPIALKRLRNGRATLQNWKAMVQFWVSAALIKTDLLELFPNSCILASEELLNDIQSSTFVEVAEDINATIDWDESANLGRVTVKPLVDEELDTWKETLAGLDSLLSRVAENVAEDVPPEEADLYGELSVIYFPQLGYLISIPVRQDCPIEEQRVGLQGWAFQFMTDESVYFKSNKMHARQGHSITICTGANASGKSVYLKQCALIPYMAQVGCFVPAISARLGVIERVFTRIQTRESVSKMQSALMIDLNQVSLALRNASTSRSIIILDEFGKGTISSDGAGLFAGVIKYLLSLGDACPFVFAATHFHEVLTPSILPPSSPISFIHMSVMITTCEGEMLEDNREEAQEDRQPIRPGEAVTYLFKVSEGLCLHSHASKIRQ
ncbi:MutS protein msh5 [Serendipita sp. 397]|nr:MutS protein msh5 [Serendipita sp. 397]